MTSIQQDAKTPLGIPISRMYHALIVALIVFWIGAAHSAVSANECNGGAYRDLSMAELAYSDISALHADRGCQPHKLPFIEDRVEYPVLLALSMWLPSQFAPTGTGFFLVTSIMLTAALLAMGVALFRIRGANPWIMLASPALYVYGTLNWDLLAMACLAVGIALIPDQPDTPIAREKPRAPLAVYLGMIAISLGVWTKLFPIVGVWALLVIAFRHYGVRSTLMLAGVFGAVSAVLNAPFAILAFDNWSYFFKFNGTRQIDPSIYTLIGLNPQEDIAIANRASFALLAASAVLVPICEFRTKRVTVAVATAFMLMIWLFGNKVFSPQYWIWAIFAYALAGGNTWLGLLAGLLATLENLAVFSVLSQKGYGFMLDWQPWFRECYWPCVRLRYLVFFMLALETGIRLWRSRAPSTEKTTEPQSVSA